MPAVNKVELYLSFHGNDRCAHCVTCSGPEREETLPPADAHTVIGHIAEHSVLTRLGRIAAGASFSFTKPEGHTRLDRLSRPPRRLGEPLSREYADCLMGKGHTASLATGGRSTALCFGRPSIRISGGEFFTWPHKVRGRAVDEQTRLRYQADLLGHIRAAIPDYDVYILTNGRFASSPERAERVVRAWAGSSSGGSGRTRLCLSVDVFHRPPPKSTVRDMLERVWRACRRSGLGAPFLYGVPNRRVALVGRALTELACAPGTGCCDRGGAQEEICPSSQMLLDPVDLVATGGCNELKGFLCETPYGTVPVNNIVVTPEGELAYCCACVGTYGDFVNHPEECLRRIVSDPLSVMLRRRESAAKLLRIAAELDPTIAIFGTGETGAATGSTCYQLLSGVRVGGRRRGRVAQGAEGECEYAPVR